MSNSNFLENLPNEKSLELERVGCIENYIRTLEEKSSLAEEQKLSARNMSSSEFFYRQRETRTESSLQNDNSKFEVGAQDLMDFLLKFEKTDQEPNYKKHLQVVINSESEEIPQEIEENGALGCGPSVCESEKLRLNFLISLDERRSSKDPNVFSHKEFSSKGSMLYGSGEHQYRRNDPEYESDECGGYILQRAKKSGFMVNSSDLCNHFEVEPAMIENILSTLGHDQRSSETFLDTDSYY